MSQPFDPNSDLTPGEIRRTLSRIETTVGELRVEVRDRYHRLSGELQTGLGPLGGALVKLERCEQDIQGVGNQMRLSLSEHDREIRELKGDVIAVTTKTAWLAGIISAGGFFLSLLVRKFGG